MDRDDRRKLVQLASLLGPGSGAVSSGVVGGALAPDRKVQTGIATGLGAAGGGLGGGLLGALAGGGLGHGGGALLARLLGEDGAFGDEDEIKALGRGLGIGVGSMMGAGAGSWLGAGAGHDAIQQKEGSFYRNAKTASEDRHMSNQQIKHAFAIGALEKLAEYGVNPRQFVKTAHDTRDPGLMKIASTIVELDQAFQREKQAGKGQQAVSKAKDVGGDALDAIKRFLGKGGDEAADAAGPSTKNFSVPKPGGGGGGGGGAPNMSPQAMGARHQMTESQKVLDDMADATAENQNADGLLELLQNIPRNFQQRNKAIVGPNAQRQLNKGLGVAGGGLLGGAGLAGGGAYAMGDADTLQNQLASALNENVGTDIGTESRISQLLGG